MILKEPLELETDYRRSFELVRGSSFADHGCDRRPNSDIDKPCQLPGSRLFRVAMHGQIFVNPVGALLCRDRIQRSGSNGEI